MMSRLVPLAAFLLACTCFLRAADNTLSADERAAGWELLFDGTSFNGWRGFRSATLPENGWEIRDGTLHTLAGVRGSELITIRKFTNFELSWDWRLLEGGNNGVKYFVTEDRPRSPGHEYQMLDDAKHRDGQRGARFQTASFYEVLPPAADKPLHPPGDWNTSRIVVRGQHVEHWLNGAKVLAYELGSDAVREGIARSKFKDEPGFGEKIAGHIMLTYHQDECWFKNLKLRELK
jgi:hypothetical protein